MFKRDRLYRVVKHWNTGCVGCILRYEGIGKDGDHYGKPVKLGITCQGGDDYEACWAFQRDINESNVILVEHESMVKFCKKLRKELRK